MDLNTGVPDSHILDPAVSSMPPYHLLSQQKFERLFQQPSHGFTLFSKLPAEIRQRVWEFALPRGRIFNVFSNDHWGSRGHLQPSIRAVCHESWCVTERIGFMYGREKGAHEHNLPGLWFNPEEDMVLDYAGLQQPSDCGFYTSHVQILAIPINHLGFKRFRDSLLDHFWDAMPSCRRIVIVFTDQQTWHIESIVDENGEFFTLGPRIGYPFTRSSILQPCKNLSDDDHVGFAGDDWDCIFDVEEFGIDAEVDGEVVAEVKWKMAREIFEKELEISAATNKAERWGRIPAVEGRLVRYYEDEVFVGRQFYV